MRSRLRLQRETLVLLGEAQARQAAGGDAASQAACSAASFCFCPKVKTLFTCPILDRPQPEPW